MRIKLVITGILACATLAAVSGCKKEQPAADAQTPKANESLAPAAAQALDTAKTTAAQAVETATTPAAQLTNQAAALAQSASQQAQGLIDRAKSLVADNKYQDALTSLSQLKNVQLTADQHKLVDDLKAKIQAALAKAAAGDAGSALGGALGGKK